MSQMSLKYHTPDMLIEVSRNTCSTFDFYKADELDEIGKHAAFERIEIYKNK